MIYYFIYIYFNILNYSVLYIYVDLECHIMWRYNFYAFLSLEIKGLKRNQCKLLHIYK